MNKKLLGIAAVALLGVSAAFAATTSTVYFTASGTLTKVVDPLDGIEQTGDNPGGRTHDGEVAIGVSKVEVSTTASVAAQAAYKGETISTGDVCKVRYSTVGRLATGKTGTTVSEPPYVYKELILSEFKLSKKDDYVLIPFYIYNATSATQYFAIAPDAIQSKGSFVSADSHYYYTLSGSDDLYTYCDVRIGNTKSAAKAKLTGDTEGDGASYYNSPSNVYPDFTSNSSTTLYLYIGLKADFTESTDKTITNATIALPSFGDGVTA